MMTLRTASDINNAFLLGLEIEVWQDGEKIGVGFIKEHTKFDVVLDDGMHYFTRTCQFRLKS